MNISPVQYYVFLTLALVLGIVLVIVTTFAISKPKSMQHKELSWLLLSSAGYLLSNSLELLASSPAMTVFFARSCYLFIGFLPAWWLLFSMNYVGLHVSSKRWLTMFMAVPFLTVIIAFTNDYHHWLWAVWEFPRIGPFTTLRPTVYGPWFWIILFYCQVVAVIGTFVVLRDFFRKSRSFNRQSLLIAIALLLPLVLNLVYVLKVFPLFRKDFSAIAYAVSGILLTIGVYYDHLFDLPPIARRALIEAMTDPLIVVDERRRIVAVNRPAAKLDDSGSLAVGAMLDDSPFLAALHDRIGRGEGQVLEVAARDSWYEARWSEVPVRGRSLRLYSLRDITIRRRLLKEKTELVAELTDALHRIRTLEGIIPICASCKKIRDDSGYWQQVESYVASRTAAEFSHGLCPDCRQRLYPEMYENEKNGMREGRT